MIDSHSLPPQNIEAEESILGGILLDPDALGRVIDLMTVEAFYVKAHRQIYEAMLNLQVQGKPTDLMTVSSWLQDHHLLDSVGGMATLTHLLDRTVSAVNIDRHAALVMDKYLRRQLITTGHEIVALGYDTTLELETILDEAEKKIFRLTQKRPTAGLVPLAETLVQTYSELEKLHQKITTPGVVTDFYDLDAMTGGLQRSDLIILAGRPSMGKTAFGLSMAANIAKKQHLPIAIFSLEMSKEQLAIRLLASEAQIDSNRLRTGHFSQAEYEPLTIALGNLSSIPIFIDDTANITVMQIRSQVRKLQTEHKGQLGLVLIDYLQLMEGSSDNRVQELSKITRSLKGLAREIHAPVIALSQLSRAVESRTNKRPMMSDLRESGCISGDSLITLADSSERVPIQDLLDRKNIKVLAINQKTLKLESTDVSNVFCTGQKTIFHLKTRLGRCLKVTANHQFLAVDGWKRLDRLDIGEYIAIPRGISFNSNNPSVNQDQQALSRPSIDDGCTSPSPALQHRTNDLNLAEMAVQLAEQIFADQITHQSQQEGQRSTVAAMSALPMMLGRRPSPLAVTQGETSLYQHKVSREGGAQLAEVITSSKIANLAHPNLDSDIDWDTITEIIRGETEAVFDLTVPELHNFIANDIIVHNSIEQDADLIMMIYRDEYYNPDSPDQGIAELLITKHRNGPTGVIKLIFKPEFTQFLNLKSGHEY